MVGLCPTAASIGNLIKGFAVRVALGCGIQSLGFRLWGFAADMQVYKFLDIRVREFWAV